MTAIFDTLAFAHRMEESGMDRRQSEALASAMQEIAMAEVATKADVRDAVHTITVRGFAAAVTIIAVLAAIIKL